MAAIVVKPEFLVDTSYMGDKQTDIAGLPGGGYVMVWASNDPTIYGSPKTQDYDIIVRRFSATGAPVGSEVVVNTSRFAVQSNPSVTTFADGSFIVVWQDAWGTSGTGSIRGQMFNAAGAAVGGEMTIGASPISSTAHPTVVSLTGGGYAVIWDTSSYGVAARVYNAAGQPLTAAMPVATTPTAFTPHATALQSGGFAVVWDGTATGAGINLRIFNSLASPVAATVTSTPFSSGFTKSAQVTQLADGTIAVAYTKEDTALGAQPSLPDIYVQLFTTAGARIGGEILVNGTSIGPQKQVSIASLTTGGFVVTWWSRTAPIGFDGVESIQGQMFDAAGQKIGAELTLTSSTLALEDPEVGVLSNGNVVFSWDNIVQIKSAILNPAIGATLIGTDIANTFVGTDYADRLEGKGGNDTLTGNGDDDRLDGGTGADTMNGGAGNDTFVVDEAGDVVVEGAGQGIDTVESAIAYLLAANVENLTLTGTGGIGGTGNALANLLTGNSGDNALSGGVGNDQIAGLGGDDVVDGGMGNDILDGGANGAGGDTVTYANGAAVKVNLALTVKQSTGGGGMDTLSGFENLIGSIFNDVLTADANVNIVSGLAGNDTINGGAGADRLDGGEGLLDIVSYASSLQGVTVSLLLQSGAAQASPGGDAGGDVLTGFEGIIGSAQGDTLTGDGNANRIEGGLGDDVIEGGAGDDLLVGGGITSATGNDTASYAGASSGVVVSLALTAAQDTLGAGKDKLTGFESLTGSAFDDSLTGSRIANMLSGGGGSDTLMGGLGNDILSGGSGTDYFVFNTALNVTTNVDQITDFSVSQDVIRLENAIFKALKTTGPLDAAAFVIGASAQTAAQHVIYDASNGHLLYDSDGSGAAAAVHFATLAPGLVTLGAARFEVT